MLHNTEDIIKRLKIETDFLDDIIYRTKIICKRKVYILFNEPLTSSDKISDFIVRSLNYIEENTVTPKKLLENIQNSISNFKYSQIENYDEVCFFLHRGFTIILVEGEEIALALETKGDIKRGIATPETENTVRGAKDSFIEEYQTNIGLVKKRIRSNNLWIKTLNVGRYTQTQVGVLSIHGIVKPELVDLIIHKIKKINIDGILNAEMIKNLIEKENSNIFPTVKTTERPDIVAKALLDGKVAIIVDNSPYALILPTVLNDFFKNTEDIYGKSLNVTFTRVIRMMAFWISLLTPAIYIALITYSQEILPTDLLVNFAIQRSSVPFPAFFEALIMIISFEILRESDLRVPSFSGSALSIVGALILGEAAVNAGIVSPIMIIVIAITSISSLIFTEQDLINSLRWYRLLFMIGASTLGIVGVILVFIFFLIQLADSKSFGKPYLIPFAPTYITGLKNSIVKFPLRKLDKRLPYLSDNIQKETGDPS